MINITPQEYEILLKTLYLGTFVADTSDNEKFADKSQDLFDKILSLAPKFGKANRYDPKNKTITSKFETEEDIASSIDNYEEEIFWEYLEDEMVQKDMIQQFGEAVYDSDPNIIYTKEEPFRASRQSEFQKNGVRNIFLKK